MFMEVAMTKEQKRQCHEAIYQLTENDEVIFEGTLPDCFKQLADRLIDNLSDPRIIITTVIQLKPLGSKSTEGFAH